MLHFYFFTGRPGRLLRNSEFRFYLLFTVGAMMFVAMELVQTGVYGTFSESLRYASFQVVSIITTTGFTTTDFDAWPAFVKWVLFMLMFFGACAGSTSGSVKALRIMVLFQKSVQGDTKTRLSERGFSHNHRGKGNKRKSGLQA